MKGIEESQPRRLFAGLTCTRFGVGVVSVFVAAEVLFRLAAAQRIGGEGDPHVAHADLAVPAGVFFIWTILFGMVDAFRRFKHPRRTPTHGAPAGPDQCSCVPASVTPGQIEPDFIPPVLATFLRVIPISLAACIACLLMVGVMSGKGWLVLLLLGPAAAGIYVLLCLWLFAVNGGRWRH